MRPRFVMFVLTLALAGASAGCQSELPSQRTASMSKTHVGFVETLEDCSYDDGGFGAAVRHFGETTSGSENPYLNPCWPN